MAKAEEWDVFEREWSEMLEVEEIGWFHTVFGMKMRGRDLAVVASSAILRILLSHYLSEADWLPVAG